MKSAAKNKGGRPPLPPGQKRTKPLFVLMTPGEHQGLVELARQNARSLSEEVVRRLRATLQRPDWEDSMELLASNARTARRVLLEHGWRTWDDPRYGLMLLAPGSTPPQGLSPEDIEGFEAHMRAEVAPRVHDRVVGKPGPADQFCPDSGSPLRWVPLAELKPVELKVTEAGRRRLREVSKAKTAKAERRSSPKAPKVPRRAEHARHES